uniref:Uncharacterized protein n=1 Tax=Oryza sativa subsp. japonica TaxID=39947 RepID=Q6YYR4_ORYSJ|nr:hypothetical protein [Oryza sativa Japonica Group]
MVIKLTSARLHECMHMRDHGGKTKHTEDLGIGLTNSVELKPLVLFKFTTPQICHRSHRPARGSVPASLSIAKSIVHFVSTQDRLRLCRSASSDTLVDRQGRSAILFHWYGSSDGNDMSLVGVTMKLSNEDGAKARRRSKTF